MTTNHHTPVQAGTEITAASLNEPLGQLDEAIANLSSIIDERGNAVLASGWNTGHIVLGNAHLWVTDGVLYIKASEPRAEKDGTPIAP